jgi:secondary thiamine-phosphate synthase enzyme
MASFEDRIEVLTGSGVDVRNITEEIQARLRLSPIKDGILCLSLRHTTCALTLNEDERGLMQDLRRLAAKVLDPLHAEGEFRHDAIDNNARAHLTATLLGGSITLPIRGGAPGLGAWQSVLLIEMDGPRRREIDISVVG